jgi:hypothetical protein
MLTSMQLHPYPAWLVYYDRTGWHISRLLGWSSHDNPIVNTGGGRIHVVQKQPWWLSESRDECEALRDSYPSPGAESNGDGREPVGEGDGCDPRYSEQD